MSIQEIINFIKYNQYIQNDEISYSNSFRGDFSEYKRCGNMYITILKDAFINNNNITTSSIYINHNDIWFFISFIIDFNDIFWNISISNEFKK